MAKHSVDILIKAHDQASKKMNLIGKSAGNMGSMFKKAAAAAVIYFSGRAIKNFAVETVQAYADEETSNRKLQQALIATGHAAGLGLGQLKEYANEMQRLTTFNDEAVKSNMAILSTFKEIKGDQFKEATLAAMDMTTLLGTDLKTNIIQVGKALNDPVAGISALTRSGVSFTEQQKDQIKSFVKANDVISAQKIILQELSGEFGGQSKAAAQTYAGTIRQMGMALDDVKEAIGKALMPAFRSSAIRIKNWAENNGERIGKWAEKAMSSTTLVKDHFFAFANYMKGDWRSGLEVALEAGVGVFAAFGKSVLVIIDGVADAIGPKLLRGIVSGVASIGYFVSKGVLDAIIGAAFDEVTFKQHVKNTFEYGRDTGNKAIADIETESMVDVASAATAMFKSNMKLIAANLPQSLQDSFAKALDDHKARLADITGGGLLPSLAGLRETGSKAIDFLRTIAENTRLTVNESRFLTHNANRKTSGKGNASENSNPLVGRFKKLVEDKNSEIAGLKGMSPYEGRAAMVAINAKYKEKGRALHELNRQRSRDFTELGQFPRGQRAAKAAEINRRYEGVNDFKADRVQQANSQSGSKVEKLIRESNQLLKQIATILAVRHQRNNYAPWTVIGEIR